MCATASCVDLTEPWKGEANGGSSGGSGGEGGSGYGGSGGTTADAEPLADSLSDRDDGEAAQADGLVPGVDAIVIDGDDDVPAATSDGPTDDGAGGADGHNVDRNSDAPKGGSGGASTGGAGGRHDGSAGGSGGTGTGGTTVGKDGGGTGGSTVPDAQPDVPVGGTGGSVPTAGLVAYYACDDASGKTLADKSGNGNHADLMMGAGTGAGYTFVAGKVDGALSLLKDGGGYVSMPPAIFDGRTEITIATWVRARTIDYFDRVFDLGKNAHLAQNDETKTIYMTFVLRNLNNRLAFGTTKTGYGSEQQISEASFSTGVWRHLAVVIDAGGGTLYIDGDPVGSQDRIVAPAGLGTVDYAYIGWSQFTGDPFLDGDIDEFRVYERALPAAEIRALYNYVGP